MSETPSAEAGARLVTLITGARKGLGRFLAEYYLERGHAVIGCSRGPSDLSHERYDHFEADVADESAVKSIFKHARKQCGGLDHLINNAGIASMNHAMLTPIDTVQRILGTNVTGTFLFCREAARLMQRKGRGRIVNMTTVAAPLNVEGEAAYAASKAAVKKLTEVLAREFAPMGITVNAVGPNPIKTDIIRAVPEAMLESVLARQAIRRFGEPEDVANVIDFFLRPESDFVTGQNIYLGGVS